MFWDRLILHFPGRKIRLTKPAQWGMSGKVTLNLWVYWAQLDRC